MNKTVDQIFSITQLIMKSANKLDNFLSDINCEKSSLNTSSFFDIHGVDGFSGHNIWINDELIGQIHLATLKVTGFVIYRRLFIEEHFRRYDYYNEQGEFIYSSDKLDGEVTQYQSINMDNTSPFTNHLYNILHNEYQNVPSGNARTTIIKYIEEVLNKFISDIKFPLTARKKDKDFALINIINEIYRIESDSVITWQERQQIFKNLKEIRKKIINTKARAHKFNKISYLLGIYIQDIISKLLIIKNKPWDNIKGFLYQLTIGNLLWFLHTVRSNLGYSIALAIYGPFTFYFITQPMNPHAMWAVGKVRNAYIQVTTSLESKKVETIEEDEVKLKVSALKKDYNKIIDWETRMSDFKAMQIALEANMVFAERMGRIEQMENQFSFPLTAESSWHEIERYINQIQADLNFYKNLDINYKTFLNNEIQRALEDQKYIWKKMAQFFLDHPYIVIDQENKQTQRDYYVGRAFIFMDIMTKKFSKLSNELPPTHQKVYELANLYRKKKIGDSMILTSLKNNSKLFSQNKIHSSNELRKYMKRHWEVLFIQQNKKQEASSFGLQAYTWSIKNAIWCLQSIYSIKRDDIKTLSYKYNLDNLVTSQIGANRSYNEQYENLFHLLNIEYVSLKKEFSNNLSSDNEAKLREELIARVRRFIVHRDNLYLNKLKFAKNDRSK